MPVECVRFIEDKEYYEDLDCYPGLRYVQRLRLMTVELVKDDLEALAGIGLPAQTGFKTTERLEGGQETTHQWTWASLEECEHVLDTSVMEQGRAGAAFSELRMHDHLDEKLKDPKQIVTQILEKYGIDTTSWDGLDHRRKVEDLASELEQGTCALRDDGHTTLLRVVRVMCMRVWDPTEKFLVVQVGASDQPDTSKNYKWESQLPGGRQEPHEPVLDCANRVLREYLCIDEEDVDLASERSCEYQEEITDANSYPGLPTLYMKFFVECRLSSHVHQNEITRMGLDKIS